LAHGIFETPQRFVDPRRLAASPIAVHGAGD
jgi:hypothetical protein